MFSILNSPYPCHYNRKENVVTALLIGTFVAVFLIVFKPFSIPETGEPNRPLISVGFGVVSFLVILFFYFIPPRIFKNFFDEKDYTLGKDLLASAGLIICIGLANGVYAHYTLSDKIEISIWVMIWQTFLVGIFPLSFLSLVQYNRLLNSNLKSSQEIQLPDINNNSESIELGVSQYFTISGDQKESQIELQDLLYLESDGNYAYLYRLLDGSVTKSMHRTTLKNIELDNLLPNIFRCHRSYIVNLDQIEEVNGNAQGLKLSLKDCEHVVPVSKKYIKPFKDYFSQS